MGGGEGRRGPARSAAEEQPGQQRRTAGGAPIGARNQRPARHGPDIIPPPCRPLAAGPARPKGGPDTTEHWRRPCAAPQRGRILQGRCQCGRRSDYAEQPAEGAVRAYRHTQRSPAGGRARRSIGARIAATGEGQRWAGDCNSRDNAGLSHWLDRRHRLDLWHRRDRRDRLDLWHRCDVERAAAAAVHFRGSNLEWAGLFGMAIAARLRPTRPFAPIYWRFSAEYCRCSWDILGIS